MLLLPQDTTINGFSAVTEKAAWALAALSVKTGDGTRACEHARGIGKHVHAAFSDWIGFTKVKAFPSWGRWREATDEVYWFLDAAALSVKRLIE